MAGITAPTPEARWTTAQLRAQYAAIARLRWRITVNNFRRKGGAGEIAARVITYPLLAAVAIGPTIGVAIGAYYFASTGHLAHISWLLWGTFALCQLFNIQLGQPATVFDPTQLIRFPLSVRNYIAIRLFFGLLTPANVIGTMMSFAVALGIIAALPSLCLYALLALAVFAAANVLFSRMVFAWVDRWLSTRRAREVFTGLIFLLSLGFQFVNVSLNPGYRHHHHSHGVSHAHASAALSFYHHTQPLLAVLPPELTASALTSAHQGHAAHAFALILACAAFAILFLTIFALRMRTEFRGEILSDTANAVSRNSLAPAHPLTPAHHAALAPAFAPEHSLFGLSSAFTAILGKEILYVRRNTGIFYSLVTPVVLVFLYTGMRAARGNTAWIFPASIAYALLGVVPLTYNSFGFEGAGAQFYFLAPVRLRDVFLAKNLINFLLALIEIAAIFLIITYVAAMPTLLSLTTGLLWALASLLFSTTLGNRRSITAPKKIDVIRMGSSKQASPSSALLSMAVLLASAAVGATVLLLTHYVGRDWIALPFFAIFAALAIFVYASNLNSIDNFALSHRDELFAELCKK